MLQHLVGMSIRARRIVLALALALVAYGVHVAAHAKLDVFPDFVQPQVVVQTEAPGLSPEQVELLVTRPVEGVVSGVSGLESVRSQSIQGLSIVTVIFREETDPIVARQMLAEQLASVATDLPGGVKPPRLTPLTSATMDLLKIGLVSGSRTPMELRDFADWTLRPRLQAVPGVASVGIMGGEVRELQVQVDPQRLAALSLGIDDVIAAARLATGVRGAGFVETANQRVILQTDGQAATPERLGQAIVSRRGGAVVRLCDVATVTSGYEPKFGDASIQGRPGVLVKLLGQFGANTLEVTRAAEAALDAMQPLFAANDIQVYPRLHRPATFIETALHHVTLALLVGGVLVAGVLFVFLFNVRTALISLTAIPLSLLAAVIVLQWLGLTLNTITLGGLAIAIGEVVDDAIIDVENIFRRLKENRLLPAPRPAFEVVLSASLEVRSAVVYATFVVVLVFLPVVTMSGLQGRMFAPLGFAYILAILASLLVALIVTPALAIVLLPSAAGRAHAPVFLERIRRLYAGLLSRFVGHAGRVVALCAALTLLAGAGLANFGAEFLPEFREGHFVVQINLAPGTSLTEMTRVSQRLSRDLLEQVRVNGQPVIATVEVQAGRAELGEDPWGPHRGEIHVELRPDTPGPAQASAQEQIQHLCSAYPAVIAETMTFLGDRISETLTGETAPVVVSLYGDDLDVLDEQAQHVAAAVSAVPGAIAVRVAAPPGAPTVSIRLEDERLKAFGFQPVAALEAIQTAYQGVRVAQVNDDIRVHNVVVILPPSLRQAPEAIGDLLLRNDAGQCVRLRELADVTPATGRSMIAHDGGRRRQSVTCSARGRDLAGFVADAKARVARLTLPHGTYVEFGGAAEARDQAVEQLRLHALLAGGGVLLLLASVFHNLRNLAIVLANLPFAFVGGVAAVAVSGGTLSIGSIVGFVTLFGITMRNSVMMMSHFEHLVRHEGCPWNLDTVLRGAAERLVPILMTATVTGLGLLPIALGAGEVGREIEGPMAIVILGGLATSTLLNLLVLPLLALRFARIQP
ncbi:MAG: efflux RND transporter permease subunit [Phycisphaerae bacterium]